ncbi:hypothetical protein [Phytoactinopolyspora mesophila]|uniref:CU044_5270 family protein n=1 Tax=Phytoactinopolyspora mesophila TaxID=2650750 RepID=A0A7K3M9S9_9ACTN|nr:hypothetical protein [Phytoactinopolyspora mesophila]NDL59757.1 hypothetical protein [Phytoactinopolyspora mesophila]
MSSTMLRLNSFESPPDGFPPDREHAVRRLLESVVRETHEAELRGNRSRRPRKRPSLPVIRLGLATATAVVLMVVSLGLAGVLRPDAGVAHAATPTLVGHETSTGEPAADVLRDLAGRAAGTPSTSGDDTIRTERWSLAITADGGNAAAGDEGAGADTEGAAGQEGPASPATTTVTTAIIPVQREMTRLDDGSVSVREVGGEPQFPNDAYRRAWDDEGRPGPHGAVLRDEILPPGQYHLTYPADLPTEPALLQETLATEQPDARHDTGALFLAIHQLRNEQVPSGEVQAGLLELLAERADVVTLGQTTDRAGREAVAIATNSTDSGWPLRFILLIDPDDGHILGYEQVLTGDVAHVDVAAPAVIDYTLFH